ncbi:MAG: zinc metallopeptidase [Ruminococcaceae bacterium]|nr:zinc metallopeptidase [Oscillospiraceae bacterium]
MPYYGIGFDIYYIVLVLPAIVISLLASARVKSTFSRYSKYRTMRGITGYMAARKILDDNGLSGVQIMRVPGELTDYYDPKSGTVYLSDSVYDRDSVGAVGVAAHEAGHAVQYAQEYFPIKIRTAIIGVTNIGSTLSMPMIVLGIILSFEPLILIGVILFSTVAVFQLVTLPVEFNASKRAIAVLEGSGMLESNELSGAKRVLSAAAMTYVAALILSVAQILRLVLVFLGGRRRK